MDIRIIPQKLRGAVTPPASKSMAHRAVLAMALAGGTGTLSNLSDSQDIQATKRCVAALKAPRPEGELPFLFDLLPAHGDATVLIGPEGDFTPEEVERALAAGYQPVSLGRSRLRTETAALVAVQLMNLKARIS